MAGKRVERIDYQVTKTGLKMRGRARSDRGTRYTTKAVELDFQGMTKKQRKDAIIAALAGFLPEPSVNP